MTEQKVQERRARYLPHLKIIYNHNALTKQESERLQGDFERMWENRKKLVAHLVEDRDKLSWKEENDLYDMLDYLNGEIKRLTLVNNPGPETNQGLIAEINKDTKEVIYDAKKPITEQDINEVNQALQNHDGKRQS